MRSVFRVGRAEVEQPGGRLLVPRLEPDEGGGRGVHRGEVGVLLDREPRQPADDLALVAIGVGARRPAAAQALAQARRLDVRWRGHTSNITSIEGTSMCVMPPWGRPARWLRRCAGGAAAAGGAWPRAWCGSRAWRRSQRRSPG